MFRRIEIIQEYKWRGVTEWCKTGLMGGHHAEVVEAWIDTLNVPRRRVYKRCKFYFTETGWTEVGRDTIDALQRTGTEYRVLRIKEKSVDVFYRDRLQVATRPRK